MRRLFIAVVFIAQYACAAEISQKDRASARIQYDLGVDNFSKGNIPGALAALLQSEKQDSEFAELHSALGLVYLALGKTQEAEVHLKTALELKPGWSEAHNNLGSVYLATKRYSLAIEEFRIAFGDVLYPTPALAEGNLGYALYLQGEHDQGLKHLKNATLLNPKFCRGYMWLGELYQKESDFVQAEKYLDRFVDKCIADTNLKALVDASAASEVYYRLGQVTQANGQLGRAKSAFENCVKAGQDTPFLEPCEKSLAKAQ